MTPHWVWLFSISAICIVAAVVIVTFVMVPIARANIQYRRHLIAAWGRDYNYGGKKYADAMLPPGFKSPMQ